MLTIEFTNSRVSHSLYWTFFIGHPHRLLPWFHRTHLQNSAQLGFHLLSDHSSWQEYLLVFGFLTEMSASQCPHRKQERLMEFSLSMKRVLFWIRQWRKFPQINIFKVKLQHLAASPFSQVQSTGVLPPLALFHTINIWGNKLVLAYKQRSSRCKTAQ